MPRSVPDRPKGEIHDCFVGVVIMVRPNKEHLIIMAAQYSSLSRLSVFFLKFTGPHKTMGISLTSSWPTKREVGGVRFQYLYLKFKPTRRMMDLEAVP